MQQYRYSRSRSLHRLLTLLSCWIVPKNGLAFFTRWSRDERAEKKSSCKSIIKKQLPANKVALSLRKTPHDGAPATMGDQEIGADHTAGGGAGGVSPCNYMVLRNGCILASMCMRCDMDGWRWRKARGGGKHRAVMPGGTSAVPPSVRTATAQHDAHTCNKVWKVL